MYAQKVQLFNGDSVNLPEAVKQFTTYTGVLQSTLLRTCTRGQREVLHSWMRNTDIDRWYVYSVGLVQHGGVIA